jgi:hypothetical protein
VVCLRSGSPAAEGRADVLEDAVDFEGAGCHGMVEDGEAFRGGGEALEGEGEVPEIAGDARFRGRGDR